jgi:hypothetical protein
MAMYSDKHFLAAALSVGLIVFSAASASDDDPTLAHDQAKAVSDSVKRGAKAVAERAKAVAHEVAAAGKEGAHQVAATAKKGAEKAKAAANGAKTSTPP